MGNSNPQTDSARWLAVKTRDAAADGSFVYAVRTTKIYCRPVCKARLARRANVAFYPSPNEAEAAGFRACKRCRPATSGAMPEDQAVLKVRSWMLDETLRNWQQSLAGGEDVSAEPAAKRLADMAAKAGVSKWHFHRIFKDIVGQTPAKFLEEQKSLASSSPAPSSPRLISSLGSTSGERGASSEPSKEGSLFEAGDLFADTTAIYDDTCTGAPGDQLDSFLAQLAHDQAFDPTIPFKASDVLPVLDGDGIDWPDSGGFLWPSAEATDWDPKGTDTDGT